MNKQNRNPSFTNFPVIRLMRRSLRRMHQMSQSHSLQQVFRSLSIYQYCGRAVQLVWSTDRLLTLILALLTVVAGLLPGAIAYVGKLIVDGVVFAAQSGLESDRIIPLRYLGVEAIAVVLLAGSQQGLALCQSLLRVLLGQQVNLLILRKALTLDLRHFEDSEYYDKMSRARREASSRPLSLVGRSFGLVRDTLSIVAYGGLLLQFSGWAALLLMVAAIPAFVVETRFAGAAFRLFQWRSPEAREQHYLETLLAREDFAMEVKLYQLGPMLLERYQAIFDRLYTEDRDLTLRRSLWSYLLSLISTVTFYGTYIWIVLEAIAGRISLGDLTMYLVVFRQGQTTFAAILSAIGGMYEDGLYLSNLYEFLEEPIAEPMGYARFGPHPEEGLRFEHVSFRYPGTEQWALMDVSFQLRPGEKLAIVGKNGSGKTTLIKLLTRLYSPDSGRIFLDGLELPDWDLDVLQRRIGVIFQNFVRYQFTAGENIGAGDVDYLYDQQRWQVATDKGTAKDFIEEMPAQYQTRLGRWFKDGRELSGGQWQKIALSRAFMRSRADILVLDEPTSAVDAEAEVQIFERLRAVTQNQMAILISHRFSTVRLADHIIVLVEGAIAEQGTHEELMRSAGQYAQLFALQAAGYK